MSCSNSSGDIIWLIFRDTQHITLSVVISIGTCTSSQIKCLYEYTSTTCEASCTPEDRLNRTVWEWYHILIVQIIWSIIRDTQHTTPSVVISIRIFTFSQIDCLYEWMHKHHLWGYLYSEGSIASCNLQVISCSNSLGYMINNSCYTSYYYISRNQH